MKLTHRQKQIRDTILSNRELLDQAAELIRDYEEVIGQQDQQIRDLRQLLSQERAKK